MSDNGRVSRDEIKSALQKYCPHLRESRWGMEHTPVNLTIKDGLFNIEYEPDGVKRFDQPVCGYLTDRVTEFLDEEGCKRLKDYDGCPLRDLK